MIGLKWIILLVTAWFTSTISGIAGFGGSLIMIPVASYFIGVKKAIPILTIAWMMGNFSRAVFGYKEIRWRPVLFFCLGALPAAVLGSKVFVELPAKIVMKGIGGFLLVILLLRHFKIRHKIPEKYFVLWGMMVGFLSAVAGSAGPIGAIAFLSLNLPPSAYVASEAVTATAMHLTKTIVYGGYALLSVEDVQTGIILGLAMVLGSWTGRKFIKQLKGEWFKRFVDALILILAVSLFL